MSASPTQKDFQRAMDETWRPAEIISKGPWTLRRGLGGGKRVSAATTDGAVDAAEIELAVSSMIEMGQTPTFMIRAENEALDQQLEANGFSLVDPVLILSGPVDRVAKVDPAPLAAIPSVAPLALMEELWINAGIDQRRIDVTLRTKGPKTWLFSRHNDQPAGGAFAAVSGKIAMVHALFVSPDQRRAGVGQNIMGRAAIWGRENGATEIAVATTGENLPAQGLFMGLGMEIVDKYHYRMTSEGRNLHEK